VFGFPRFFFFFRGFQAAKAEGFSRSNVKNATIFDGLRPRTLTSPSSSEFTKQKLGGGSGLGFSIGFQCRRADMPLERNAAPGPRIHFLNSTQDKEG